MISIVMPTVRVGGLDVVFNGLQNQTFADFELIISDGLYKYRKELILDKSQEYDFIVKHVEPTDNPFPINSFCKFANTGLAYADGDVILFIVDYTWLPPDCLEKHYDLCDQNHGVLAPHDYAHVPELHPDFPKYAESDWVYDENEGELNKYINDLDSGKLDNVMWSIFKEEFVDPHELGLDAMSGGDLKLSMPRGAVDFRYFFAKNASCKAELIFKVNGWDEDLDGSHGYQDSDLSGRLVQIGMSWFLDPSNIAIIINPRHIFPRCKRTRSIQSNEQLWLSKHNAGYPSKVNNQDIRDYRK